ncbi:MAG: formate--tetrahydrofolate ligase [Verrucomicrobia bacterium]|nr:formate--tetrahydrofolate ligase [Verrucomicrobiota bacterium]
MFPSPSAETASLQPISAIAARLGLAPETLEPFGRFKAKLPLSLLDRDPAPRGRLILVSAITPTPAGEGKTTTSIGIADGLTRLGHRTAVVLREPSLGPVFGMKGGATGGGRARVGPHADINLHFNGDFAAIEKAHNLLAALVDNHLQSRRSPLGLDPVSVRWKRVCDMNDRALRRIVVGLGGRGFGLPRETGFDITAASEVMAILCLAQSRHELKERLGRIFVGFTHDRRPIFARDLKADGAMAALLKDALLPNLVQTLEGTPALIHGGPFGNIAQGTNSILATRLGLCLADYVVTEAGFGFDLGGEKFLEVKCRAAGLWPDALALVATIRALKYQGGAALKELAAPHAAALRAGFANLEKHLENAATFGLETVVVINRFASDTDDEVALLRQLCADRGVPAVTSDHFAQGGAGAEEAAAVVAAACHRRPRQPTFLYDLASSVEDKITAVATRIYGAGKVEFGPKARQDLKTIAELGLTGLPVCIAKTQYSLSDNPALLGRPRNFTFTVREIEIAAGAGFLVPISGEILRMPGLPESPAAEHIDIDDAGNILGLT